MFIRHCARRILAPGRGNALPSSGARSSSVHVAFEPDGLSGGRDDFAVLTARAPICIGVARGRSGRWRARAPARRISHARAVCRRPHGPRRWPPGRAGSFRTGRSRCSGRWSPFRPGPPSDGVLSVDAAALAEPARLPARRGRLYYRQRASPSSRRIADATARRRSIHDLLDQVACPRRWHGPAPDRIIATLAELPPLLSRRYRADGKNLSQNPGERPESLGCQMRARSERRDSTWTYVEARARTRKRQLQ